VRTGTLTFALVMAGACAGVAMAAGAHTLRHTETFELAGGKTEQFSLPYPDALEHDKAIYAGSVNVLGPSASERGRKPDLRKVHIRSEGNTLGGSDYSTTVVNANGARSAPVRVIITTTTTLP
jgi:hypothetical protein